MNPFTCEGTYFAKVRHIVQNVRMTMLLSTAFQKTWFRCSCEGSLECLQSYAKFDLCVCFWGEALHVSYLQLTEILRPFNLEDDLTHGFFYLWSEWDLGWKCDCEENNWLKPLYIITLLFESEAIFVSMLYKMAFCSSLINSRVFVYLQGCLLRYC